MKTNTTPLFRTSVTRREFLGYTWLVGLAALSYGALRAGVQAAQARVRDGEYGGVFNMGPLAEAPITGGEPVSEPAGRFWLHDPGAGLVSLHKACTHLDCLCDWDDQNRQFVCPCHGSRYAEDGAHIAGPAARALDRFVVQISDPAGEIVAETDPANGAPLAVSGAAPATAAASEDEDAAESPTANYLVLVDTGRLIPGKPAG